MITLVHQVDKPCSARLKEAYPQTRIDEAAGGKALLSGEFTEPPVTKWNYHCTRCSGEFYI